MSLIRVTVTTNARGLTVIETGYKVVVRYNLRAENGVS